MRAAALLLAACAGDPPSKADSGATRDVEDGTPRPAVVVSPVALDFGEVAIGLFAIERVTVTNTGDAGLALQDVHVDGPEVFTVGDPGATGLGPGAEATFLVTFTPTTPGDVTGTVFLTTDDPVQGEIGVPLSGRGVTGIPAFTPSPVVLPPVDVGCVASAPVSLVNEGEVQLLVDTLSASEGYTLSPQNVPGDPPWIVRPGESIDLVLEHRVAGAGTNGAVIQASTSGGTIRADVTGEGIPVQAHEATFFVDGGLLLDVIVTVDRSEGMEEEAARLADQLERLVTTLVDAGLDYQLTIVQVDDGCPLGDVSYVTQAMPVDEQGTVLTTLLGTTDDVGDDTERGFTVVEAAVAWENLGAGGCYEGLVRDDADLAILGVTDEVEQSANGWAYYVGLFESLKDDPRDLVVHAIAGDYPSGCEGNEPGRGWYEATIDTEGTFTSVCLDDYTPAFEALAAATPRAWFPLEPAPGDEALIRVTVDGVVETSWRWDGEVVYLDTPPARGAVVVITWDEAPDCG